jgi:N6-L-threonylcarbamoyladenine synthase
MLNFQLKILAIETSCDETSAAIVQGSGNKIKVLSNIIGSQIKIHQKYGGVVPELAARRHAEMIIPVVDKALKQADIVSDQIDAIAVTNGPGLMIALLVGLGASKSLAYAWDKPLIGVNHLEGHIYSILNTSFFNSPNIALIVSGGHTELVLIKGYGKYQVLGRTRDDAAGEAFDKVAKILGLPYPGGPSISCAAQQGIIDKFDMPRPMLDSQDFNFSFSGIKTHVLYLARKLKKNGSSINQSQRADIAASFQEAVVDVLVAKTIAAAIHHQVKAIIITGGVSANLRLRQKMAQAAKIEKLNCYFPLMALTGDNAAMIGIAGLLKAKHNGYDDVFTLCANPNLKL